MAALVSVQQSDLLFLSSSSTCDSFNRYEPRLSVSSREGCNGKFAAKDKTLINDQRRIIIKHFIFQMITFLGQLVLSYALSFVVSIAFEAPVVGMLKIVSPKKRKRIQ